MHTEYTFIHLQIPHTLHLVENTGIKLLTYLTHYKPTVILGIMGSA